MDYTSVLKRLDANRWELPQDYKPGMRVPGMIFADDSLLPFIVSDPCVEQVANVAFLPGIVGYSMAMPDIHWGYGFPIGGVAATDVDNGRVVSPGGVGFDINCGIRLLRADLTETDVRPHLRELVAALFRDIHTGSGPGGRLKLSRKETDEVLREGGSWSVRHELGDPEDLEVTEEDGCMEGADPLSRGRPPQDPWRLPARNAWRGKPPPRDPGSRRDFRPQRCHGDGHHRGRTGNDHDPLRLPGPGHQVCTDSLRAIEAATDRYGIELPDRQLAAVPVSSPEGETYLAAMQAAANFAWANRQCIAHWARMSFEQVLGRSWREMGIRQVYDISHNMAKIEEHTVNGRRARLCVHRKGATRAFPPGHSELPPRYRDIGQPVLIPGDMGRYSFLAVAAPDAMEVSFGSTCHGAGRAESRTRAKKLLKGRDIRQELEDKGIIAKAHG